jgi:hypothetical protein
MRHAGTMVMNGGCASRRSFISRLAGCCLTACLPKAPAGEYPAIFFGLSETGGVALIRGYELSLYNP